MCSRRNALAGEADRICQLAKLDPEGFSVAGPVEGAVQGGQIALVVGDGVEIVLPLAGILELQTPNTPPPPPGRPHVPNACWLR